MAAISPELRHQHETESAHQDLMTAFGKLKTEKEREQFIKNQEKKVGGYPKGSPKKEATERFLTEQKAKKAKPVRKTESDVGGIAEESDLLTDVLEDQLAAIEQTDSNAVGKFFIDLELSIAGLDASNSTKIKTEAFLKRHAADKKRALRQTGEFSLDASLERAQKISEVLKSLDAEFSRKRTLEERNSFLRTLAEEAKLLEDSSASAEAYADFLDAHKEESEVEPTERDIEEQLAELEWRRNKDAAPAEALAFFEGAEGFAKDGMANPAFVKAWERFSETHKDEIAKLRKPEAQADILTDEEKAILASVTTPGEDLSESERLEIAKKTQEVAIKKVYDEVQGVYEFAKAGGKESLKVFFSDLAASLEKSMKDNKRRAVENFLKDHKEEREALNKPEPETPKADDTIYPSSAAAAEVKAGLGARVKAEGEPMTSEQRKQKVEEMIGQFRSRYDVVADKAGVTFADDVDSYQRELLNFYKQIDAEAEAARSSDPKSLESEALSKFLVRASDQINRLEHAVSFADALKAPGGREKIVRELKNEEEQRYLDIKQIATDEADGDILYYNQKMLRFFEDDEKYYGGLEIGSVQRDALGEFLNDHQKEIDDLKRAVKSSEKPAPKVEARTEGKESGTKKFIKELDRQYEAAKKASEDAGDSEILLNFFLAVEEHRSVFSKLLIFSSENTAYASFLTSHKQEILDLKKEHQEVLKAESSKPAETLEEIPAEAVHAPEAELLPILSLAQSIENPTPEMGSAENEMVEARNAYIEAVKERESAKAKKGWLQRTTGFISDSFKGIIGQETPPDRVKQTLDAYKEKRIQFGKEAFRAKQEELITQGVSGEELDKELGKFCNEQILLGIFAQEENLIQQTHASELMPEKKQGIMRKSWEWYKKQPLPVKIVISTAIMTGAFAVAGEATVASVATFAGARFARALTAGVSANLMTGFVGKLGEREMGKLQQQESEKIKKVIETESSGLYVIRKMSETLDKNAAEKAKFEKKILAAKVLSAIATGMGVTTGIGLLERNYLPGHHEVPKKLHEKEAPKGKPLTIEKPALAAAAATKVDLSGAPTSTVEPVSVAPNIVVAPEAVPQEVVSAPAPEQHVPVVAEREIPTHEEPIVPKAARPAHVKVDHSVKHVQEHAAPKVKVVAEKPVHEQPPKVAKATTHTEPKHTTPVEKHGNAPHKPVTAEQRATVAKHVDREVAKVSGPLAEQEAAKRALADMKRVAADLAKGGAKGNARVAEQFGQDKPFDLPSKTPGSLRFGVPPEPKGPSYPEREPLHAPESTRSIPRGGAHVAEQTAATRRAATVAAHVERALRGMREHIAEPSTAPKVSEPIPVSRPVVAEVPRPTAPPAEVHPTLNAKELADAEARKVLAAFGRGASKITGKLAETDVNRPAVAGQTDIPESTGPKFSGTRVEPLRPVSEMPNAGVNETAAMRAAARAHETRLQSLQTEPEHAPAPRTAMPKPEPTAPRVPTAFQELSIRAAAQAAREAADAVLKGTPLDASRPSLGAALDQAQHPTVVHHVETLKPAAVPAPDTHAPTTPHEQPPTTVREVARPKVSEPTRVVPEHTAPKPAVAEHLEPKTPLSETHLAPAHAPDAGDHPRVVTRGLPAEEPRAAEVSDTDSGESITRTHDIIPKSVRPYSDYLDHKGEELGRLAEKYADNPVRAAAVKTLQDQYERDVLKFSADAEAHKFGGYTNVPKGDIAKTLERAIEQSNNAAPVIKSLHNIGVRFIQDHGSLKPVLDAPSTASKIYNAMDWKGLHIFKSGFASEALERNHDYVGRHLGQIDIFRKALDSASGSQAEALKNAIKFQMKEVMDTVAADDPKEVFDADLVKKFWRE